ncbi:MAG: L-glutamate gamma-semialdehyde dehydrogenase [Planctomycetota bacterium]|nr:MAG: L-glutamate gamma-semialdehyde dehydrogenase [Planctomycetota bacterium]
MLVPFKNEPLTDFSKSENHKKMEEMLRYVESRMGEAYPLYIGGEEIMTERKITSINPANVSEVVGYVSKADKDLAEKAILAADSAFQEWRKVSPRTRAEYLFKAAAMMRRRKLEFAAWMVIEEGKNWVEADADVAEAIDFLEFYGRQMIELAQPKDLVRIPGEDNEVEYIPLGVGAIIPPWNFPVAILVGMLSSALVAGNTVVLKPASAASVVAAKVVELFREMNLPKGVLNFCPGSGDEIGDFIVSHPRTRFISFTGSKSVGIRIYELAAKVNPGQIWLKRVVAEMGGKDVILVDDKVFDFDDMIEGIVKSAFGYQGQKCSACSRLVVHKDMYDRVVEAVIERTRKIRVGDPRDPMNYMGPVIDRNAFEKIRSYIEHATEKKEGRLAYGGKMDDSKGFFVEPTIFVDVPPSARISCEEIFGPVLAVIKADSFEEGMAIVNNTEYGLTGSLYSSRREHIEHAKKEFHVGNFYVNRHCTGALVGVHPFGGFNMSGTDSKAGGFDYLLLFTQAKAISEKM